MKKLLVLLLIVGSPLCPSLLAQKGELMIKHGLSFLDTPYVAHTLERAAQEELFTDRSEVDCTTFVEDVMAMTLCEEQEVLSESEFAKNLQRVRYRNGILDGYTSRLHYVADWINDNIQKGIIEDITAMYSEDKETLLLNYMSTHPDKYTHLKSAPQNVAEMAKHEQRLTGQVVHWLPKEKIPHEGLSWIKDGDIIMLTTNIKGLDVSHMGLAIYQEGKLHLLHASSIKKKVIIDSDTLRDQLQKSKHVTGIRVLRMAA